MFHLLQSFISPLNQVFRKFVFFARILLDFTSDIVFQLLFNGRKKALPPLTHKLLAESATTLAHKIRRKELSSEELVRHCIDRIGEVQAILNAVVDQRFEEAIEEAKAVDRIIASLGPGTHEEIAKEKPFLGVPFSTKEGIQVKNLHHSYGVVGRSAVVAEEDADCVRLLRKAGAIPLCVTNVSELGLWWESTNYVYGTTRNPYDTTRTPGGSSGGESALQTSAGIPISIASDTGGSIRTPAAFCGLFGHKPTPGIVSTRGTSTYDPPNNYISSLQVVGPMARHAEDLMPVFQILVADSPFGPALELEEEVHLTRLRFFYLDGGIGGPSVSPVEPEVRQAVMKVVDFLEENYGVLVKPLRVAGMDTAKTFFLSAISRDSCEPPTSQLMTGEDSKEAWLGAEWLRTLFGRGRHTVPTLSNATLERLSFGSADMSEDIELETFRNEFIEELGDDAVLICPTHPTVPPYHFQSYVKPFNFLYTAIFNVLGVPSTVVPVGLSQAGLPLSVQIVAGPKNDRLTLGVARALERPFGGWIPPFRHVTFF